MRHLMAVPVLLIALAGCGDSDAAAGPATDEATVGESGAVDYPADQHSEMEVVGHIGAVQRDGWYYYPLSEGEECEIAVVLTDAGMVSLYADAGDLVASNPPRTAGVKIGSAEDPERCHAAITEALATLG